MADASCSGGCYIKIASPATYEPGAAAFGEDCSISGGGSTDGLNVCLDFPSGPVTIEGPDGGVATMNGNNLGVPFIKGKLTGLLYLIRIEFEGFSGSSGGVITVSGGAAFLQDAKFSNCGASR